MTSSIELTWHFFTIVSFGNVYWAHVVFVDEELEEEMVSHKKKDHHEKKDESEDEDEIPVRE